MGVWLSSLGYLIFYFLHLWKLGSHEAPSSISLRILSHLCGFSVLAFVDVLPLEHQLVFFKFYIMSCKTSRNYGLGSKEWIIPVFRMEAKIRWLVACFQWIPMCTALIVDIVDKDVRKMLVKADAPLPVVRGMRVWPWAIPPFTIGHLEI